MDDLNQTTVPESFVALFVPPGRIKPIAPRDVIARRYELCEDLAVQLTDYARAQHFDLGLPEAEVLARCHRGLASPETGLEPAEAIWVVRRLAELEGWPDPGPVPMEPAANA